jgi:hypothetical protein
MCLNFTTTVFLKNLISAKSDMHMMYDIYDNYSTFLSILMKLCTYINEMIESYNNISPLQRTPNIKILY